MFKDYSRFRNQAGCSMWLLDWSRYLTVGFFVLYGLSCAGFIFYICVVLPNAPTEREKPVLTYEEVVSQTHQYDHQHPGQGTGTSEDEAAQEAGPVSQRSV